MLTFYLSKDPDTMSHGFYKNMKLFQSINVLECYHGQCHCTAKILHIMKWIEYFQTSCHMSSNTKMCGFKRRRRLMQVRLLLFNMRLFACVVQCDECARLRREKHYSPSDYANTLCILSSGCDTNTLQDFSMPSRRWRTQEHPRLSILRERQMKCAAM